MMTKTQIINSLQKLPENLTIDQVIEHLIFIEKIQKGMDDSENGNILSNDEAKEKLNKWFQNLKLNH